MTVYELIGNTFITDQTKITVYINYEIENKITTRTVKGSWFNDQILDLGYEEVEAFIYRTISKELNIQLISVKVCVNPDTEEAEL